MRRSGAKRSEEEKKLQKKQVESIPLNYAIGSIIWRTKNKPQSIHLLYNYVLKSHSNPKIIANRRVAHVIHIEWYFKWIELH